MFGKKGIKFLHALQHLKVYKSREILSNKIIKPNLLYKTSWETFETNTQVGFPKSAVVIKDNKLVILYC